MRARKLISEVELFTLLNQVNIHNVPEDSKVLIRVNNISTIYNSNTRDEYIEVTLKDLRDASHYLTSMYFLGAPGVKENRIAFLQEQIALLN